MVTGTPNRGTILVIEDDADIRDSVSTALEAFGYPVATARNGREGLDALARGTQPCLILLDLMMPVMTGLEFLEVLREDVAKSRIPVVVLSAYTTLASQARTAGFLRKPIDLDDLVAHAARYCDCPTA